MHNLDKKRKNESVLNVRNILPKFLIFLLLFFSLVILTGFAASENSENSVENFENKIYFDVKIIDFESPMELGEFFEFTYLVRGMSGINDDIKINFWIEKQGKIVSSGSDTVYIGDFKEKIETTKIFLPKKVESGVYDFVLEIVYGDYEAKSHRTIEIEIKKGTARITTEEGKVLSTYVISALIALAIFVLSLIFYLDRKKIKTQFLQGERWIKKYKKSVLIFALFLIMGILFYYLNLFGIIVEGVSKLILRLRINVLPYLRTSSFHDTLGVILIFVVLAFLIIIVKKKKVFKKLKREQILEKQYKTTVKESKIKFKKISKTPSKIIKKLGIFLKRINPLKLIKKIKIKKIKFKQKKEIKKPKKLKKPIKIKKKKIKIKNIFSKYHPLRYIKRFFKKIRSNLKKVKIKFPKKQKKKEKLIKVQRVHEKPKKLEAPKKLKFKKFWIKIKHWLSERKQKKKEKLIKVKKFKEKNKQKKIPRRLKRKKIRIKLKKVVSKAGICINKVFRLFKRKSKSSSKVLSNTTRNLVGDIAKYSREHKRAALKEKKEGRIKKKEKEEKNRIQMNKISGFFKKQSKSSKTFVSKKSKQISKEKKEIARKAKRELKKASKNIFRLLKKIFGKKSQKKIMRDFEKSIVETKKFSMKSLETLKSLVHKKVEIKRKKLDFSKVNELGKNAKDLMKELADHLDNLISSKKKSLKQKLKFYRRPNFK